jgi:hypothetical protein
LMLEGPLSSASTFMISGRESYPDKTMRTLSSSSSPIDFHYSELTAKLTNRLTSNQQISLSGYFGNDDYRNSASGNDIHLNNHFSWNNGMLNLHWIGITTPSLFLSSALIYSHYGFDLQHIMTVQSIPYSGIPLSSNYSIGDVDFLAQAEAYYDENHTVRSGIEVIHHSIDAAISKFSTQTASLFFRDYSAWEASFYLQDQWKILPGMSVNLGARATSFAGNQGSFSAIDPRFSVFVSINEQTRFYSSFSTINQFLHPYRNSGVFLFYPTTFWYPSTDSIHPTTSIEGTLGIERSMANDAYLVSIESYYRVTNNLHEFTFDSTTANLEDLSRTILLGTGKTFGIVFNLEKRYGDFTGKINYNLSWAFEQCANLNYGNEFSPPFDRRHEVQLQMQYRFAEEWMAGATCVLTSQQSASINQTMYLLSNNGNGRGTTIANASYELLDVNGSRLPGFQRLELSVSRNLLLFHLPSQVSLRLLNSYGLMDTYSWTMHQSNITSLKWRADLRQINLFPLYPALSFNVKF